MNSEEHKALAEKHFKAPMMAYLKELVVLEVVPKADKMVLDSENKVDDVVWAMAKEALLKAIDELAK